jgi:5-methylcytosine-specific restriction endonuclease McrA
MRTEFTKQVKLAAYERAAGHCEVCSAPLIPGCIEYDHIVPCAFGGSADLDNCEATCPACHGEKTTTRDIPAIAKSRRIRLRQAGICKPRTITAWRRFNGSIVRAARER